MSENTRLDELTAEVFASQGAQEKANQFYLHLLQANLFLPTYPTEMTEVEADGNGEPFYPYFYAEGDKTFVFIFDTLERLHAWAGDHKSHFNYVEISGKDVVAGLGENVHLCLNIGNPYYKQFSPDEIRHLKKIVSKIMQLTQK